MFNIYIEEKKKKEKEDKEKLLNYKQKFSKQYKRKNEQMLENYNRRIKSYILQMATSEPKVVIKDYKNPVESSRMQYLDETSDLIRGRKGFLLGGFKSEKQRIKESIKLNQMLYGNNLSRIEETEEKKKRLLERKNFSQPQMRYKPRTDLERIFELINSRNANVKYKTNQLDFNQLKQQSESSSVDIHSYSKRKPAQHKEEDDSFIIPIRKNINSSKISDSNVNSTYLSSRFLNINKEAKRLINDSKYKTNFKAVISIANDIYNSHNNSTIKYTSKDNSSLYLPESYEYSEGDEKNDLYYDRFFSMRNKERQSGLSRSFILPYTKNKNPNIVIVPESNEKKEQLNKLKSFAFNSDYFMNMGANLYDKGNNNSNHGNNSTKNNFEDPLKREDDKIVIGKETFNVNRDLDLLATKVLNKCNVRHQKNINANNSLKAGEGKLMITNGMSINDFLMKYNLY